MMSRARGYIRPVSENTRLFFGNRPGSIGGKPSTASFKDNETTANTDQSSSMTNATPSKPMYSGNVAHHLSTPIPDSQTTSVKSQYLRVPSPPPLDSWGEPEPFRKIRQSSHCGTQAESIKPSWYESGTAFLGKAKSFCKESVSYCGKAVGGWSERWSLSGHRETARQCTYRSHLHEMMRRSNASSTMGGLVKAWAANSHRLWTRCIRNRRTEAASRSESHDEE